PSLRFIPTGGIRLENAGQYLQNDKIHAVGGSWMAKRQMIAEGQFEAITMLARQSSALVKQIRRPLSP
ncbi:MAG: 2-dehydro-3-deoxyphosphogluconate aldolase, partial [Chloroflexota bacterium]|nr:2-dehydro-3-deoxyphosphogluconate aldolase [Chloroflexota bacterium]